jgi:hypothetical protein
MRYERLFAMIRALPLLVLLTTFVVVAPDANAQGRGRARSVAASSSPKHRSVVRRRLSGIVKAARVTTHLGRGVAYRLRASIREGRTKRKITAARKSLAQMGVKLVGPAAEAITSYREAENVQLKRAGELLKTNGRKKGRFKKWLGNWIDRRTAKLDAKRSTFMEQEFLLGRNGGSSTLGAFTRDGDMRRVLVNADVKQSKQALMGVLVHEHQHARNDAAIDARFKALDRLPKGRNYDKKRWALHAEIDQLLGTVNETRSFRREAYTLGKAGAPLGDAWVNLAGRIPNGYSPRAINSTLLKSYSAGVSRRVGLSFSRANNSQRNLANAYFDGFIRALSSQREVFSNAETGSGQATQANAAVATQRSVMARLGTRLANTRYRVAGYVRTTTQKVRQVLGNIQTVEQAQQRGWADSWAGLSPVRPLERILRTP